MAQIVGSNDHCIHFSYLLLFSTKPKTVGFHSILTKINKNLQKFAKININYQFFGQSLESKLCYIQWFAAFVTNHCGSIGETQQMFVKYLIIVIKKWTKKSFLSFYSLSLN